MTLILFKLQLLSELQSKKVNKNFISEPMANRLHNLVTGPLYQIKIL